VITRIFAIVVAAAVLIPAGTSVSLASDAATRSQTRQVQNAIQEQTREAARQKRLAAAKAAPQRKTSSSTKVSISREPVDGGS
jgi:hypothetical protein